MSDPIIRGPKVPLKWSTTKAEGYVVEKFDRERKTDTVEIEDEDSAYICEITGLRRHQEISIEVMPLSGLGTPPIESDIFEYGEGAGAVKFSIAIIKESTAKGGAMKWTMSGKFLPLVHT